MPRNSKIVLKLLITKYNHQIEIRNSVSARLINSKISIKRITADSNFN